MSELARIAAHYFNQIIRRAGYRGLEEARAELEAAADIDGSEINQRFAALEKRVAALEGDEAGGKIGNIRQAARDETRRARADRSPSAERPSAWRKS